MGCFWIGINHTSHGLLKVSPRRRLLLELISLILLVISWCVIVPGVIHVGTIYVDNIQEMPDQIQVKGSNFHEDTFKRSAYGFDEYRDAEIRDWIVENPPYVPDRTGSLVVELYAVVAFMLANSVYLVVTIFLAILNLIYRKDILLKKTMVGRSEWKEREKNELCFDICNPLNGLRMFHHLEHRGAFLINLFVFGFTITAFSISSSEDTKLLKTILGYSSTMCLITLAQTFLSYFYAEDVALCGMSCCCVHFWFVRRYPQEQTDVALTVASEENPARLGKYDQFHNEDDFNPPAYNQVVQQV